MIAGLNKEFDHRVRLGIMSMLMVDGSVDFNSMKQMLQLTDGNLASHVQALERSGMVMVHKSFAGRKPRTTYSATETGRIAFKQHLLALESIIRNSNPSIPGEDPEIIS